MKPKNADLCPVCNSKTLENGADDTNISWIRCDICRQWYHSLCLSLTPSRLSQISSFHCPECEDEHGPSHMKRQSKRARIKVDYVALDQGETFAVDKSVHPHVPNFLAFEPAVNFAKPPTFVDVLDSAQLTKEYVLSGGLTRPVVVHHVTVASGLTLPQPREKITVAYIAEKTGPGAQVEVMDVLSQQSESPAWSLKQWQEYFYTSENERDRIRNVISLEVSQVGELGTGFVRPDMVVDLDLVDKVWCDADGHAQKRPQVTVYCLMSVRGSYTDFHIDFSGTPVYYTVCQGTKTFLMYPPTADNLALYESWCLEPQQNFTWFCEYTKRVNGKKIKPSGGFKVSLQRGDLFIIPSGWIHSVYTPDDAVVIGGNYLTLRDLPMHLKIYDIEKRTRVPGKYRFPMFNKVLWLASWYYFNHRAEFLRDTGIQTEPGVSEHVLQPESVSSQAGPIKKEATNSANADSGFPVPDPENEKEEERTGLAFKSEDHKEPEAGYTNAYQHSRAGHSLPRTVLQALVAHLAQHYEASKTQPVAKKSIPTKLIGRNVKEYLAKLESWLATL